MKRSVVDLQVEKLLRELHAEGVEFVIIGGMAAVAQGSAFLTADLDLCYSRKKENLERLAKALAPFNPTLRDAPNKIHFRLDAATLRSGMNFTLTTEAGDLDISARSQDWEATTKPRSSQRKWRYLVFRVRF